jgi:uncharacterized protein
MKLIFTLGHPAHFHLYKFAILKLIENKHEIKIIISDKDILRNNLDSAKFEYTIIAKSKANEKLFQKGTKLIKSSKELYKICKEFKPDLMIGCLSQMGIVGFLLRIKTIFNAEDDASYTFLQATFTYPFINRIMSPMATNLGIFNRKKTAYDGFHKLAYLHPNYFNQNDELVKSIIGPKPFVLIRLVNLNAYHDINAKGISEKILNQLISLISLRYKVFITSEKPLIAKFEQYQLNINPNDIHYFLASSQFFIGDSQSMTVEAAMMGVPNIKFNSFAGRISVLEELEHKYGLTIGINPKEESKLFETVNNFLSNDLLKEEYQARRQKMLADKIDVTAFFVWFFQNYPQSAKIMKDNPNFQNTFK